MTTANIGQESIGSVDDTYDVPDGKNFKIALINTNARSLCPKIDSLITCMEELEAAIAVVTETWFTPSQALEDDLLDLRGRAGLSVIRRDRPPNLQGTSHGGVAIVYNDSKCTFSEVDIGNQSEFEVVVGCGRFVGFGKPVLVVACYLPPNYTVPRGNAPLLSFATWSPI